MWPRTQTQRKVLVGERDHMGPPGNRSGRLPSCSLRTGMAALAGCFFCAPFLSVCMYDSPLCLGRFLLLGVSSCHKEEAWWLKAPSSVLCAMLRFRRLFVNTMGKQRYHKMKYRVVLLAGTNNSYETQRVLSGHGICLVFPIVSIFLLNTLETVCCHWTDQDFTLFCFRWVITG